MSKYDEAIGTLYRAKNDLEIFVMEDDFLAMRIGSVRASGHLKNAIDGIDEALSSLILLRLKSQNWKREE